MTATTSGPSTATVESLTAQVRVLMVGNRQITLSVAKQLDCIPLRDVRVMGRVRIDRDADATEVIGCDDSGNLVRSSTSLRWPGAPGPVPVISALSSPIQLCRSLVRGPTDAPVSLSWRDGTRILISHLDIEWCPPQPHWATNAATDCGFTDISGPGGDEIDQQIVSWQERRDRFNELVNAAHSAPLIVLAGLR